MYADNEKMQIKKRKDTITLPMTCNRGRSMNYMEIKRITDYSTNDVDEADPALPTKASNEIKMPREIDIKVTHGLCHLGENF